jgi:hypothetical protein
MNSNEIVKIASLAGFVVPTYQGHIDHMIKFAEIVAQAEREKLVKNYKTPLPDSEYVVTLIIIDDAYKEEFDYICLRIRELAKKSIPPNWPFVDIQPMKITIAGCEVRTNKK